MGCLVDGVLPWIFIDSFLHALGKQEFSNRTIICPTAVVEAWKKGRVLEALVTNWRLWEWKPTVVVKYKVQKLCVCWTETRKIYQKKVSKRDWVENFGNEEGPSLLLTLALVWPTLNSINNESREYVFSKKDNLSSSSYLWKDNYTKQYF